MRVLFCLIIYLSSVGARAAEDCLVGEIRLFAGVFAPQNWMPADGREILISGNLVLFTIIGTLYGGDGKTTFKIPDLRGRVVVGTSADISLGKHIGQEYVALPDTVLHQHLVKSVSLSDAQSSTEGNTKVRIISAVVGDGAQDIPLATEDSGIAPAAIDIRQPSVGLNYMICINGTIPTRP